VQRSVDDQYGMACKAFSRHSHCLGLSNSLLSEAHIAVAQTDGGMRWHFSHLELVCVVPELGEALKRFVEKDEKLSLADTLNACLEATQEAALETIMKRDETESEAGKAISRNDHEDMLHVIDIVHAAGQTLQKEAIKKFADTEIRMRAEEEAALRGDGDADMTGDQSDEGGTLTVYQ
jgi:hypothetical protein